MVGGGEEGRRVDVVVSSLMDVQGTAAACTRTYYQVRRGMTGGKMNMS